MIAVKAKQAPGIYQEKYRKIQWNMILAVQSKAWLQAILRLRCRISCFLLEDLHISGNNESVGI